ncbi:MAG: hypothetical protein JXA71_17345 [Chitinispirillaceae bacterium]|nr:hypothetical protein [Chitinispirillaceae bacterium]
MGTVKTPQAFFFTIIALISLPLQAHQFFIATNGGDNAAGTITAPLATIPAAVDLASPGDTIYVRGGSNS